MSDARTRALVAAEAASDKLAHDIVVLEVGDIIGITEYFVICSANNTRQVRTVVDEIEEQVRVLDGGKPRATEGREDAQWVLIDYGDVVVHVFLAETREYYELERLWADAPRVELSVR